MAVMLFQFRVVAGTPNILSIWPRWVESSSCAAVHPEDEAIGGGDDSHSHSPSGGRVSGKGGLDPAGSRQDAHAANNVRAWRLRSKGIVHYETHQVAAIAERNLRLEWQLLDQCSTELRP
jgi:hypothetical protein